MDWTSSPNDRFLGWTEEPLSRAWDGFELCYDCDGSKLCSEHPHPYCKGWCHVCGGAGQWPLDPSTRYFAPAAPQINLEYLAKTRGQR
jgi:hypothetical protein